MSEINRRLLAAITQNDFEKFQNILLQNGNDSLEEGGYILLLKSIMYKQRDMAKLLLSRGCRIKGPNRSPTNTPLQFAVKNNDMEIVKILLDKGAEINERCTNGMTALSFSVKKDGEEMVDLLLSRGAKIYPNSFTPLHIAVQCGLYNMTEKLLRHEVNIDVNSHSDPETNGVTPMHLAAETGNVEIMKLLKSFNANINALANEMYTPLHLAIENLQTDAARYLIKHGANVDAALDCGKTVLYFAVVHNLSETVKDILKANPDKNNSCNKTCLKIAVKESYTTDIVGYLINYGFSIEPEDIHDVDLLREAIKKGYIEILQILIKKGLDLGSNKKKCGICLQIATKYKQDAVAKLLLSLGADVNAIDTMKKTPIFYSTHNSDVIMTQLLISHGASIENISELLGIAIKNACTELVEILLQYNVDLECDNSYDGMTALQLNAGANKFDEFTNSFIIDKADIKHKGEITKLLISKGANINAVTQVEPLTALQIACQKNCTDVVEVLLEHNADVNFVISSFSPLQFAVKQNNTKIMEMLIAKGANINFQREERGDSALHIAATYCYADALKILLQNGADVYSENYKGETPLHEASQHFNHKGVALLLQHGAPVDPKDIDGRTPLHLGVFERRHKNVQLLLNYGADINMLTYKKSTVFDIIDNVKGFFVTSSDEEDNQSNIFNFNLDNSIRDILITHLIMLRAANVYILEKNEKCIDMEILNADLYMYNCQDEIEELKGIRIANDELSLPEILTKNINSLTRYDLNANTTEMFESDHFKKKYPIYSFHIERKFKKCLLIKKAQEFLTLYCGLPYDCSDHIIEYLTDSDLKIIANV